NTPVNTPVNTRQRIGYSVQTTITTTTTTEARFREVGSEALAGPEPSRAELCRAGPGRRADLQVGSALAMSVHPALPRC
ncbi:hypothetical protein, partial [Thiohalocapsa sp. ML1]|uniref:hypothetical protein n=1 Tax=Thiohalocapsa sp. ML1 TaxID=1431688 RepID=UPI001C20027C